MNRKLSLAAALAASLLSAETFAQDICSAVLQNGTFDETNVFSSSQNFSLVYNTLCKSGISTYQDATSSGGNLGVSVIDVVDVTLGGTTNSANFSQRKSQFCSMSYANVANNNTVMSHVRTASAAITAAWSSCVARSTSFTPWVTVGRNLDAFTITMQNNTPLGVFQLTQISAPGADITCDNNAQSASPQNPISFNTRVVTIGCRKRASDTILLSMNTTAGVLNAVEVPGTVSVIGDLQDQVRALQSAASFPVGSIVAWYSTGGRVPDGWAVCDGSNGTPNLVDRYIQGVATFADVSKPGDPPIGSKNHSHGFSGNTTDSHVAPDSYHVDGGNRDRPPQATGLSHYHSFSGGTSSADNIPPTVKLLYIMKTR